jgi:hypothetical protein
MSALPFDSLEVVAPTGGTTRARSERLRVVSTPRPCLIGPSFPELLEIWERALTAADVALDATTLMRVFAPEELRWARYRLHQERRWLTIQVAVSRKGG